MTAEDYRSGLLSYAVTLICYPECRPCDLCQALADHQVNMFALLVGRLPVRQVLRMFGVKRKGEET